MNHMLSKTLLHTLAATTAAAVVTLPEISQHGDDMSETPQRAGDSVSHEMSRQARFTQDILVPCNQCNGVDTKLHFEFTVSGSRLLLNEFELYPNADPWSGDLSASVVSSDGISRPQKLGYSLTIYPKENTTDDSPNVEIRIIEVGNQFIETIPQMNVELSKAPSGEVFIDKVDFEKMVLPGATECTSILCSIQKLFEGAWDRIKSMDACDQRMDNPAVNFPVQGTENVVDSDFYFLNPYEEKSLQSHNWRDILLDVALHMAIPILLGAVAGFFAALLAMFIAHAIAAVCQAVGGKRTQWEPLSHRKLSSKVNGTREEKARLMESE